MKKHVAAAALALGMIATAASPALAGPNGRGESASCMAEAGRIVRAETGRGAGQHLQVVLVDGRVQVPFEAPFNGMTFGEFITSGWLAATYCGGPIPTE